MERRTTTLAGALVVLAGLTAALWFLLRGPARPPGALETWYTPALDAVVRVDVLDGRTGAPVADADVWLNDPGAPAFAPDDPLETTRSPLAELTRGAPHARTDAGGTAELPWSGAAGLVIVDDGARAAVEPVPAGEAGEAALTVRLPPARLALVSVVDAAGAPVAGATVHLHVTGIGAAFDVDRAVTSADGRARLRSPDAFLPSGEVACWARLAVPGAEVAPRPLRFAAEPAEAVLLTLPPTAPLEVHLVDEAGAPVREEAAVILGAPPATPPGASPGPELAAPLVEGVARFPFVGVAGELRIDVVAPGVGAAWSATDAGPRAAGEPHDVRVVAPSRPWITGRLVGPDGEPPPPARWSISLALAGGGEVHRREVAVAADGTFRASAGPELAAGDRVAVTLLQAAVEPWDGYAAAEAPLELAPGTNDVGALAAYPMAIRTIAGRCVDAEDRPVGGVRVVAPTLYGADHVAPPSDAEGRFTCRDLFADRVALAVRAPGRVLTAPVSAAPGEVDVVVRLVRAE